MSDVMEGELVTKVCIYCGKIFQTNSSAMKYCSGRCAKNAKNEQKRVKRLAHQKEDVLSTRYTSLLSQEYISITDAAMLIGISRPTVYKMIADGRIEAIRFGERIVRVKVSSLINQDAPVLQKQSKTTFVVSADKLISKNQVMSEYNISDTQFYRKIKPAGLQSTTINGLSYFPKDKITKIFKTDNFSHITEWYTVPELIKSTEMRPNSIYDFCKAHNIPRKRQGTHILISKQHWDKARGTNQDLQKDYYSIPEIIAKYQRSRGQIYDTIRLNKIPKIKVGNFIYVSKKEIDNYYKEI